MKKIAATAFALIALGVFGPVKAFAQNGPTLDTLVKVDENRFDLKNKTSVEQSNVIHRTSKQVYNREVFSVRERPATPPPPSEVYIVKEDQIVTRSVEDRVPVWVLVERNPTIPVIQEPSWRYKIR